MKWNNRDRTASAPLCEELSSELKEQAAPRVAATLRDKDPSLLPLGQRKLWLMENAPDKSQPAPIHWAVGWADLMMTMFIIFLVMYLYQTPRQYPRTEISPASAAAEKNPKGSVSPDERMALGSSPSKPRQDTGWEGHAAIGLISRTSSRTNRSDEAASEMTRLYDLALLTLRDKDLARFADIELSPDRTVRINLASDLLFPSGNAALGSEARERIRGLVSLLRQRPYLISVVGHADNVPIRSGPYATNWELSVIRATTVARFLIEEMGIPPSQISVAGRSYYQPLADNDNPVNRAKNRRVEIIVSQEPQPAAPMAEQPSLL
jgi:chemotaxis protein MotB